MPKSQIYDILLRRSLLLCILAVLLCFSFQYYLSLYNTDVELQDYNLSQRLKVLKSFPATSRVIRLGNTEGKCVKIRVNVPIFVTYYFDFSLVSPST